jgi:hypothetical protein
MKKELLEEITRIKFISNYNSEFTSDENKQTLIEQTLRTAIRDASLLRGLMSDIEKVLSSEIRGGAFVTKDLKQVKTADKIIEALRLGKFSNQEYARLSWNIFRKTDNPAIMKTIAEEVVESKTFIQKYGSLEKQTFVNRLKDKFQLNSKQAEELWKANGKRLVGSTKEGESAAKTAKEAEVAAREAEVAAREAEVAAREAEAAARKSGSSSKEMESILNELNASERKWFSDYLKSNKIENFRVWAQEPSNFRKFTSNLKSRGGIWNKVFNWGKRTVLFSGLIALSKFLLGMGLLGFGVWWLYDKFKGIGFDTDCEPGYKLKNGVGCVKRGGGDEDDEDEEEDEDEEKKDKYVECDTLYKKGCKNKKGNIDILKAQECLKVNPTGLFDQSTEDALFKKINKRTFTKDDLTTICSKGFNAPEYLI